MLIAARTNARDEAGFTLIEMLVGLLLGVLVIGMACDVLVTTTVQSSQVADRTDATNRARLAVDSAVRDLQGEVCMSATQPPIIANDQGVQTDGRTLTFTSDLAGSAGTSAAPSKVRLTYDPAAHTFTRSVWAGDGTPPPSTTYAPAPTTTRIVIDDAIAPRDGRIFHYFAYNDTAPAVALTEVGGGSPAATLGLVDARRVVRVGVSLGAKPAHRDDNDKRSTLVTDDAWVGTAEGDEASMGPQC